jgi:hypothetical protein
MPRPLAHGSIAFLVLWFVACAEPPSKEMNQAQGAIDAARAAGAEQYAGAELAGAIEALKKSDEAVTQRDFRLALNYAIDSRERAQNAAKTAGVARADARGAAERHLAEVATLLTQARGRLTDAAVEKLARPLVQEQRDTVDTVEKRLQEARAALAADDYPAATTATAGLAAQLRAVLKALEAPAAPPAPRRRR